MGKLRVEAFYFLSEAGWQENKHSHEELSSKHTKPSIRPEFLKPESATAYVEIPCHEAGCDAACTKPPIGLPDENRIFPDIHSFDEKANARGKAVGDKLADKSLSCSEDAQPSNGLPIADSHLPAFRIELLDCTLAKIVCG